MLPNSTPLVHGQLDNADGQTEEQLVAVIPRLFEVPIDWFGSQKDPEAEAFITSEDIAPIRRTFERYWRMELGNAASASKLKEFVRTFTDRALYSTTGKVLEPGNAGTIVALQRVPSDTASLDTFDQKSLIFLCVGEDGQPLNVETATLIDETAINSFWDALKGVSQVFFDEQLAKSARSTSYTLSNVPLKLARAYRLLEDARLIMDSAIAAGKAVIGDAVKEVWQSNAPDRLDVVLGNYSSITQRRTLLSAQLVALSRQATAAGFYMPLNEEPYTTPDGKPGILQPGSLYRVSIATYKWITYEERVRWEWDGDVGRALGIRRRRVDIVPVEHSQEGSSYELVLPEADPWVSFVRSLPKTKPQLTNVHIFRRAGNDLISDTGYTIDNVVDACAMNEGVRKSTILLLPLASFDAAGQETVDSYQIIEAPLPQFTPVAPPRILLQEFFSATTKWHGTQVGRLVSSINLGPGEERSITLKTSSEFATTSTIVSSRSDDITDTSMVEFTSEAERFLERQFNRSSNSSSSLGISGAIKLVSFDFGAENESSDSSQQISRSINKIIDKAARTTTRKYASSLTVTTTTSERQSIESGIQYKVSNINQGRTLNLLLYQINNIYLSKVTLDLSHIVLRSGRPFCAGSLLGREHRYKWSETSKLVDRAAMLATELGLHNAKNKISEGILSAIMTEFPSDQNKSAAINALERPILAGQVAIAFLVNKGILTENGDTPTMDVALASYMNVRGTDGEFDNVIVNDVTLESMRHFVPSGAFFLDSKVGFRDSTEKYSNIMRGHEAAKASALVKVEESNAAIGFAKAARIAHDLAPIVLTEVHRKEAALELVFDSALPLGEWIPYVFGKAQKQLTIKQITKEILVTLEAGTADKLDKWKGMTDDQLMLMIRLKEISTGMTIVSAL